VALAAKGLDDGEAAVLVTAISQFFLIDSLSSAEVCRGRCVSRAVERTGSPFRLSLVIQVRNLGRRHSVPPYYVRPISAQPH